MSDHIKTSEQGEEERRAGALDSTKDQALSKDSLQHVRASAGHTDIIAAAADIQAARHSVATGPATASSSTPDCGELDQEQDGLPQTSETPTAPPGPPQTAAEEPSSAVPAPRNHLIDGQGAAAKTKTTTEQIREAAKKSLELVRKEPGLIVSGGSAKDLIRGLCAVPTYEAAAKTATEAALAIGGDSQRAIGTNGRARAHAVMYANKTSPMTSAQATAAFNGIIKDYEASQDIADHGETVGTQGSVWSSVMMFREPSGYVRSSYPTFPHPMPADGMFLSDPTFMAEVTTTAIQHLHSIDSVVSSSPV